MPQSSNIKVLRDEGVPQSSVFTLLSRYADVAFINQSVFAEYIKFVKEIGIKPFKPASVEALVIVTKLSKSTWELKLDIFERFGWPRDVALLAFNKVPNIMALSEKKITNSMKFYIEEVGLQLEDIVGRPNILRYSLKKRIVPRCSVVKILKLKGFIKDDVSIPRLITTSEKIFMENYVIKFQESVPQLQKLYVGELGPLPEVLA
ncbi:uncharacterized protein LOC114736066 [Neltuma alba]|uniref:uncharacterized protein LOC114736066 n=1 Tax=Neltuma alba TaxID=207710 RepID=UPI0010A486A0|nr:uncharacterized protein LOC114736066 [Prosopis alba]